MINWLEKGLEKLNPEETKDVGGGYTRLGYSQEESLAIKQFINIAQQLDLHIKSDRAGNVIATWEGENPALPLLAFGSHVDTVKQGGAYDGPAGILAGLGLIKFLKGNNYHPRHTIEVICFRSEESARFGISTLGSKAMSGELDSNKIKNLIDDSGQSVQEAFSSQGLNFLEAIDSQRSKEEIYSFVELHIEQGTILEKRKAPIGIVEGIATPFRYEVIFYGKASHTGTTPMDKRRDALAAASQLINFVENMGKELSKTNHFVSTVSTIKLEPNSMNVIPATVYLGIDIRSGIDELKQKSEKLIKEYCYKLSEDREITINFEKIVDESSVLMDRDVIQKLVQATEMEQQRYEMLESGAGHDAMNMAKKWKTGMVFIPCKKGISHHPDEHAKIEDVYTGIKVLANYVKLVDEIDNT